jgi:hypothetical protein
MDFLRRLFGGHSRQLWPPPGPIREWPAGDLNVTLDAAMAWPATGMRSPAAPG